MAGWAVPAGPDAAETALIEHARHVAARGCRTFVVASADRRFAQLADLGRLEVLVWDRQPLLRVLQEAAQQIHPIALPGARKPDPEQPSSAAAAEDGGGVGTPGPGGAPTAPAAGPPHDSAAAGSRPHAGSDPEPGTVLRASRLAGPRELAAVGVIAGVAASIVTAALSRRWPPR